MATLTQNQLVYNLKNLLRGGLGTNDSELSDGQFAFVVKYLRAMLVRRHMDNRARVREFQQEIAVPVDLYTSRVTSTGTVLPLLRSASRIPETVRTSCDGLVSVEPEDRSVSYDVTQDHLARHAKHGRYTGKNARAYIKEGYLWISGHPAVEALFLDTACPEIVPNLVYVNAIFSDPAQVWAYQNPNVMYTGNEPYPFPEDLVQEMTALALKYELSALAETASDRTLDGAGK